MKFSSKKVFKKAIIIYALSERKMINFIKDDPKRVRAKSLGVLAIRYH